MSSFFINLKSIFFYQIFCIAVLVFSMSNAANPKNLVYENNTSRLRADKIEIDLITKNSKIFMYNKKKKIKISGKI